MTSATVQPIPAGSCARFTCSAKGITGDVWLTIKATEASELDLATKGRMRAARQFKRTHGLHSCTKVDVAFQAIEPASTII